MIPKETSPTEKSSVLTDVMCPMPSTVNNGDRVKKGDLLVVVEAMKMEVRVNNWS